MFYEEFKLTPIVGIETVRICNYVAYEEREYPVLVNNRKGKTQGTKTKLPVCVRLFICISFISVLILIYLINSLSVPK